jgi:hypothetical protein
MLVLPFVLLVAPWVAPGPRPLPLQEVAEPAPATQEPARTPRIGPGPWDDDLLALQSSSGSSWEPLGVLIPHASTPSLCRMADGRLLLAFQWFPFDRPEAFNRVAVVFSADDGVTWGAPQPIRVEGLPETSSRPFDPCVVALEGGRLRMYFTAHEGQPAEDGGFEPGAWPATWSAVSSDGITWSFEPGRRLGVEGQAVRDPAVVRFRGDWHYFAPIEGRRGAAFHAVSADGLAFQRWPEVELSGTDAWQGCALAESEHGEPDSLLRFFGTGRVGWSATSRDTEQWRLDGRVVWGQGADPAVARLADGSLLMVATAPGVRQREADDALTAAMLGGPNVAMTANDRYLYVLRGDTIFMFEAATLRFVRMKRLPVPKPEADEPPQSESQPESPPEDAPEGG